MKIISCLFLEKNKTRINLLFQILFSFKFVSIVMTVLSFCFPYIHSYTHSQLISASPKLIARKFDGLDKYADIRISFYYCCNGTGCCEKTDGNIHDIKRTFYFHAWCYKCFDRSISKILSSNWSIKCFEIFVMLSMLPSKLPTVWFWTCQVFRSFWLISSW